MRLTLSPMLALVVVAPSAVAEEGKWTPQQVLAQGPAWVKAQGFDLPLDKLWNERAGGGLLANAVQLPGCSGSFISADGLLITNHHCVVSVLQEHSTPQANLGRDGYLARTRADEKASKAYRIGVPRSFRDVTDEVLAAVPAGAEDLARFKAVEAAEKRIVAECEQKPDTRCQFAAFDGGLFFTLTEFEEIRDVRLVYAPPESVGNYGGEVDNWMWPRPSSRPRRGSTPCTRSAGCTEGGTAPRIALATGPSWSGRGATRSRHLPRDWPTVDVLGRRGHHAARTVATSRERPHSL